jgi:hypothetical protein
MSYSISTNNALTVSRAPNDKTPPETGGVCQ